MSQENTRGGTYTHTRYIMSQKNTPGGTYTNTQYISWTTTSQENTRVNCDEELIEFYQETCKADAYLQSFHNNLITGAAGVLTTLKNNGPSEDVAKKSLGLVQYMNQESSGAVLAACNASGSMNLNSSNEGSFKLLVDAHRANSMEMLNFCTELDRFLKAARDTHSDIEKVIQEFEKETAMGTMQYKTISDKLKGLEALRVSGQYPSTQRLLENIERLRMQQEQMLQKLVENEKLGKKCWNWPFGKESRARTWCKLAMILFITAEVGLFISTIVTTALAMPHVAAVLGYTFDQMLKGRVWMSNWFHEYENSVKEQQKANVAMEAGTRVSIKELEDIMIRIKLVENEIESLLRAPNPNFTIEEQIDFKMKDIKRKLETFKRAIENLQEEANRCISEIRKARDETVK